MTIPDIQLLSVILYALGTHPEVVELDSSFNISQEMLCLTELDASRKGISELTGLENAKKSKDIGS